MNATQSTAAALALLSATSVVAAAPTPAELVERAIRAAGGRQAISHLPHLEKKGTVENPRRPGRRSEILLRERSDGAYRQEVTFEFRGRKATPVEFYDGVVVKRRFRTTWDDLPADEAREAAAHRLPFLLGVDPAKARLVGETTEADVAALELQVPDGDGTATLWIAKDDGRLVGLEHAGTSASGMGTKEDVVRKLVFRDHRPVGDLVLPHDVETLEDGSPVSRVRWSSIRALDEFDPEWVRVPDPTRRFIPSEELAF